MKNLEMDIIRLAFIQRIVDRRGDIGKTKIQKISYFLQEAVGIPLKYRFRMHYYGPYSDKLDNALSLSKSLGYIEVKLDANGFRYHVTPGKMREDTLHEGYEISKECDVALVDRVIDTLGSLETHIVELYATIHFVDKVKNSPSRGEVVGIVEKLKPKFPAETIEGAYDALRGASLI